jgi:hypothetical protein
MYLVGKYGAGSDQATGGSATAFKLAFLVSKGDSQLREISIDASPQDRL